MFDVLIFILVITIIIGATIENIRLKNNNTELLFLLAQLNIDNAAIKNNLPVSEDTEKDHLIKFLSETRDIAYKYIEDVHEALLEYKEEIEFDLINPSDLSILRFRSAFDKLKTIYPQDIEND